MAELVDAPGSGPGALFGREGSTPFVRTLIFSIYFGIFGNNREHRHEPNQYAEVESKHV